MKYQLNSKLTSLALIIGAALHAPSTLSQENLEHVVVSGSSYSLMTESAGSGNVLSKEAIDRMPHLADDVFRLLPSLPGVSAGDYSASFNIRGGDKDEVLVILDGQQLYRPFHMKSFSGAFSIIDTENVGYMDFSSGGYAANYGNKMSGVLDITSLEPSEENRYSVGASFINARGSAQGSFADGKGRWLMSGRRGYLDWILEAVEDESNKFEPIYADLFTKVQYELNDRHEVSAHLLYAYDDEVLDDEFFEDDGRKVTENISGKYSSTYFWVNLNSDISDSMTLKSKVSAGEVDEDRNGGDFDPLDVNIRVNDYRKMTFIELQQELDYHLSDSQLWQLGWNYKSLDANYAYKSNQVIFANPDLPELRRDIKLDKDGNEYSIYINNKLRITDKLISEMGVRYDKQTYMGFDDDQWSPRASLAYKMTADSTLRMSWGQYSQAQDILSLQVTDGVTEFAKAQQAEHRIISFDSQLMDNLNLRAEVFHKKITDPRARYENLFDQFPLFPEGQTDRVRVAPESADVKGVELTISHQVNNKLSWTGNYSWSEATDVINGKDVPRSWDQEHAVNLSFNYVFDNGWNLNAAYVFHSGWPSTEQRATSQQQPDGSIGIIPSLGPRNAINLGDYQRIDVRVSKVQELANSRLTWFLEVTNLLDSENECCVDGANYVVNPDGSVRVTQFKENWLPLIPSLGVKWEF